MSPILVRPVREQLEHDRVIRLLQAKYKRKFEVAINPGNEQAAPILVGTSPWYPDLVLYSPERTRKLMGTVEVETAESVNNLEAMSQWVNFSRQRAVFHLYVPASSIDTARRLCSDFQIPVAEIWAYSALGDQMRFALVHRSEAAEAAAKAAAAAEAKARPVSAPKPPPAPSRQPAAAARPSNGNGKARGARPAGTTRTPAVRPTRRPAAAAKTTRRKPAAARPAAKPAARRIVAAKKTARRPQKRK